MRHSQGDLWSGLSRLVPALPALAALLAIVSARPPAAGAMPLYASREGATCVTCHFDPNGGGMRNEFGFYYGKNRHSMGVEEKWSKVTVTPQLNDWIRLGLDMRFMYYASQRVGNSTLDQSTFFPMEGNLRVAITPYENLAIVGTQGIVVESGYPNSYVARELYALFRGMPHGAYAQVGRIRLPFGLRQEDHTSFTRERLPYDAQREDAGIEVGSVGPHWFGQFSFTNGGAPFSRRSNTFAGKIGRATKAFQVGVSGYSEAYDEVNDIARWSVYASTTRGPFTILGEYVGEDFHGGGDQAAFAEVVYRVSRGVNLRAKLDYFDPRQQFIAFPVRRYLGEIDFNPMPFANFKISYRHHNYRAIDDLDEVFGMLFVPF